MGREKITADGRGQERPPYSDDVHRRMRTVSNERSSGA